jgi:aminoglycoside phosphotransferase (APT) family kinase protein
VVAALHAGAGVIPAQLLARVPGCESGRPPLAVRSLPGGRGCNEVSCIETPAGRFVWRRRFEPVDRPGSRAIDELRAQAVAAAAGLAPRILDAHPSGHWLLMEFIDAPVWTPDAMHSADAASRLGSQLARLHALPAPPQTRAVDPGAMAGHYLARLACVDAEEARELAPLRERVQWLGQRLSGLDLPWVLNHGDLAAGNLLGSVPTLVDWEYTQVAEAGWDLACLLTYYPDMSRFLPQLLAGNGHAEAIRAALPLQRERFELLNRLWERLAARGAG